MSRQSITLINKNKLNMSTAGDTIILKPTSGKATAMGTFGVAVTGGGFIDFPTRNQPKPDPSYFNRVKTQRKRDKRQRPYPR
jgi:hypothetical protein